MLKRQLARLENTRHEAVHEGSRSATEGVANGKRDKSELKIQAKEEARKAAADAGATATQAIKASKSAAKSLAESATGINKKEKVEKDIKQLFAEGMAQAGDEESDSDDDLVQTGDETKAAVSPIADGNDNSTNSSNSSLAT